MKNIVVSILIAFVVVAFGAATLIPGVDAQDATRDASAPGPDQKYSKQKSPEQTNPEQRNREQKNTGQWTGRKDGKGMQFDMPTTVAVATVTTSDVPQTLSAVGTVTSRNTATVRARVSGQLDKILFREGQVVKSGDVLAVLDQRPFQVALDQQLAQLQRDQAQLGNAKHDLERYQGLVADKVISQQQVDTQAALVRQYEGVVAIDQAQVASAKLNFSYSSITAPISGRLGLRQVDLGNLVTSGDLNGIVVITQLNPINVVFAIPGDRVTPVVQQLNAGSRLVVDALDRDGKTKLASGTLITADNQMDPTTGTVKLKAEFVNDQGKLFPNQFVNVRLQLSMNKGAMVIPSSAVQQSSQGAYVFVVKADNKVSKRVVTVGTVNTNGNTVVINGLNVGEQVVVDGVDRLRDGGTVKVSTNAAAQAAASGKDVGAAHSWPRPEGAPRDGSKRDWQHKQQAAQ